MYPTIYHALKDLIGVDWQWLKLLNSFGFFVALAFVFGSWLLSQELKRMEKNGDLKTRKKKVVVGKPVSPLSYMLNGLMGFLLGYKVLGLVFNAQEAFGSGSRPQEYLLSAEGSLVGGLLVAALFVFMRYREGQKNKLPEPEEREVTIHPFELTGTITMIAAVGGILGAKFFHLFEDPDNFLEFFRNPSIDNLLSGLTIYGGLIVGGAAVLYYAKKQGIPMLRITDAAAPGLILAYGIGRIGCQISGDGDWGIANTSPKPGWMNWLPDWLWSYNYPNNVNRMGVPFDGEPCFDGYCTQLVPSVFPTPVYETIMAVIIFLILWSLRKRIKIPGMIFALYLAFNGLERFWIEKIRVNDTYKLLGMEITQAEIISTLLFIAGIIMMLVLKKRWDKNKLKTE
jgi:prolipoprotein diacylglyceryl transferase